MSDDEIRDLLDLGVQDPGPREELSAEQLWSAGRRQRNRGRAWLGGLGAAAAAASILGIVWAQGLAGGDAAPQPADETPDTIPGPTVEVDTGARGEPFFVRFESPFAEHAEQLSGASRPATLEDLQGRWNGPYGELFGFDGDTFTVDTGAPCHEGGSQQVEVSSEGRLLVLDGIAWEVMDCSPGEEERTVWRDALQQDPMLSLDGGTLIISGLDGTTDEPRVPVALTLETVDETGFVWADAPSNTGVTPITLGPDVLLTTTGTGDGTDIALDSILEVGLDEHPGAAAAARDGERDPAGYPSTCPLEMESSLRSDGVLLAGAPAPFLACDENSDAYLPPAEPSPAVVALLRSGPTVGFDGELMIISGTIPESLLDATAPPVDDAPTSEALESTDPTEGETGSETPTYRDDIPLVVGTPRVIVMSEGGWAPTGELTPLTEETATGKRWLPVTTESDPPEVGADPNGDRGLSFDGTTWRIRDACIDIRVRGGLQDGVLTTTGEPEVVPDPDPGAGCIMPLTPEEWEALLTGEPRLSTDGDILVISGGGDDAQLSPVGMAFVAEGTDDPQGGPTAPVTVEDLATGLVEVPGDTAAGDVGVSDVRDLQPDHAARLSLDDGTLSVEVGCEDALRGPAWFAQVGPDEADRQLIAALPAGTAPGQPAGTPPGCSGAAAVEAELWRQLLAHGVFLHHYGEYVILDGWADPALAPGARF